MKPRRIVYSALAAWLLLVVAPAPPVAAQGTVQRTATANCTLTGNRYDDLRFVLSAPAEVTVDYDRDGTWWIRQEPSGPAIIGVTNGASTYWAGLQYREIAIGEIKVSLPAGDFLLHADCSGGTRSAMVTITLPAPPSPPPGTTYKVTARASSEATSEASGWVHGYNDRIFILAARQVVTFIGGGSVENESTGRIDDSVGTTWWAMDRGTVRSGSTLDLPAGTYCLHVDWPKSLPVQFSDQWTLQFVGPAQPGGAKATVRGEYDPSPTGDQSKYQDAAFTLSAPQVINLRPEVNSANYWIVDTTGMRWYDESNGVTQSCSGWVEPTTANGDRGPLLPAGTYLLHVDAGGVGTSRYGVSIDFVGVSTPAFPWPSGIHCPCVRRPGIVGAIQAEILRIKRQIEARIQAEIERQIEEYINEMCSSAMIVPAVALVGVLAWRRRRTPR